MSSNEFKFNCPQCGQHLKCDPGFSGREIQCPACNVLIRIPHIPGQTVQYKPESGKTWATFVPGGKGPRPAGLSIKKNQPKPRDSGSGS